MSSELPPAIAAAAKEDPLVSHLAMIYLMGDFDYESFLEALVVEMAIRHAAVQGRMIDLEKLRPTIIQLNVTPEERDRLINRPESD